MPGYICLSTPHVCLQRMQKYLKGQWPPFYLASFGFQYVFVAMFISLTPDLLASQ